MFFDGRSPTKKHPILNYEKIKFSPIQSKPISTASVEVFQKWRLFRNLPRYTRPSITGTSQKRPIVVPSAAREPTPYMETAAAIAILKWLEDPIMTVMMPLYIRDQRFW